MFFLGYKVSHQTLEKLINLCNNFTDELSCCLQRNEPDGKRLFDLLVYGYTKVRYEVGFEIEKGDALKLLLMAERFIEKVEDCCKKRLLE